MERTQSEHKMAVTDFRHRTPSGARPGLCGGSRYFNVSAMYDAETDPARNLRLMTFRERIGRAKLALGRS